MASRDAKRPAADADPAQPDVEVISADTPAPAGPRFNHAITKEMLAELHYRMRAGIDAVGNPTDYFACTERLGYRLSTAGWQLARGKAIADNPLTAISDRDLHDRLKTATSAEACFDRILAAGLPYDAHSGDVCPVGLRGEYGSEPEQPYRDADARAVTVDLWMTEPMHWADTHWFDLRSATPIGRVRLDCCEADTRHSEPHPPLEVMLWRASAGRWLAEIDNPAQVSGYLDPSQPAWGEIAPHFAAHTIWRQREVELTEQAGDVPLVAAAVAARDASSPGALDIWGTEDVAESDQHCLANPGHHEQVVALRTMLISAIGCEADRVWAEGGQALADWTWIQHSSHTPRRYGWHWSEGHQEPPEVEGEGPSRHP